MSGENISGQKLAELITDAILADNILSKAHIQPRVEALIKAFVKQADRPRNYNRIPKPNEHAARLRTIEQKDLELRFFKGKLKEIMTPEQIQAMFEELGQKLMDAGFKTFNTGSPKTH